MLIKIIYIEGRALQSFIRTNEFSNCCLESECTSFKRNRQLLHKKKEIVYSWGEWITFEPLDTFERLKHRVEYGFHRLKSIRDLEKKLGRNVECEHWPVYDK